MTARARAGDVAPRGAWRRWRDRLLVAGAVYVAASLGVQLLGFGLALGGRVTGNDPRIGGASVRNLRTAGGGLLLGAQPGSEGYRSLASMGVTTVVDLRTGSRDDPRRDDPAFLESLGMRYVSLPVRDGHAPDAATMARFAEVVRQADGVVFVHCGGGVGRSTALEVAHGAATGAGRGFWDVVAVGPMTLEQLWVTARATAGDPLPTNAVVRRLSEALDAPRRAFSRLRAAF